MADLQCPARLMMARHAQSTAAAGAPALGVAGVEQVRVLAEQARAQRVAVVWSSPMDRALRTAEVVAGELRLPVTVDDRLRELMPDDPWTPPLRAEHEPGDVYAAWLEGDLQRSMYGESGHAVVHRLRSVAEEVADRHRGEAVLLVTHGGILGLTLPLLCHTLSASFVDAHPLGHGEVAEVEIDSSGWACRRWAGQPLPG